MCYCCFTGHRPEKLFKDEKEIKELLWHEINNAVRDGIMAFITEMSRGVDLWAAQIIIEKKQFCSDIKLICAIPFDGFEAKWADYWREAYRTVLFYADKIKIFRSNFTYSSFNERNYWMVDNSSRIIGVYNGSYGGTHNTLKYAKSKGIEIRIIEG